MIEAMTMDVVAYLLFLLVLIFNSYGVLYLWGKLRDALDKIEALENKTKNILLEE